MEKNYIYKGIIALVGTWIGEQFSLIFPMLLSLSLFMFVDYLSGMLAAKKEAIEHPYDNRYGWSSKKSIIGIYKKVGYILTILVAMGTDYLLFYFSNEMGISYESKTFFGLLVTIWFILNELLSILENAGRMGVELPPFLKKILVELKKETNEKQSNK
ncbi:MAG: phage holin family protein [Lachnospiraceae bacterium]|nr:phage holin family protein [Lachnospiraceae bacterium]